MKVTIRPDTIGSVTLEMEYRYYESKQTELEALLAAAWRFTETLGLIMVEVVKGTDNDGIHFVEFTIGTGRRFVAFKSLEG